MVPEIDRPAEVRACMQKIDTLVRQRLARQEDAAVAAVYAELLAIMHRRLDPVLGKVTVTALLRRALMTVQVRHPVLHGLESSSPGLDLAALSEQLTRRDPELAERALRELTARFVELLAMLTGDILTKGLLDDVEGEQAS